ncbi:MAG: inositol monophosphatase [Bacteroidia bacterium]|nr:inositol monophosphatase [Bacteroidia bacterium]
MGFEIHPEKICSVACNLTAEVRKFILKERAGFDARFIEKKGHNDLVSYVDKEAEKKIVSGLTGLVAGAGFITEEKTSFRKADRYNWIIDPLDGTTNFIHGLPCYCISIALLEDSTPVIGVVHELNADECFYSVKGGGTFLNGNKVGVSRIADLNDSLIATGFPYHDYSRMKSYMQVFDYCMRNTHGVRRLGSAAADLAYVACGRFEAFYEYGLNPWDVAAGALLVEEAGGRVTDFSEGDNYIFGTEILAANTFIHGQFSKIITEIFQAEGN